ncbi:hypothetical protein J7T55_002658 [Diaporthe amygdali]|uniref:uncharacterized protein n=1 Tax=Phomopsis amygdali TaxID=1214568 RepID=UPI0022FEAE5F|nr:uncharacterized protein J7T55_002658 [Diaporthe amygdali]KAJ0122146.1 hypothetical protein J7T55_002658 [Diaporthe amygdali]
MQPASNGEGGQGNQDLHFEHAQRLSKSSPLDLFSPSINGARISHPGATEPPIDTDSRVSIPYKHSDKTINIQNLVNRSIQNRVTQGDKIFILVA